MWRTLSRTAPPARLPGELVVYREALGRGTIDGVLVASMSLLVK